MLGLKPSFMRIDNIRHIRKKKKRLNRREAQILKRWIPIETDSWNYSKTETDRNPPKKRDRESASAVEQIKESFKRSFFILQTR